MGWTSGIDRRRGHPLKKKPRRNGYDPAERGRAVNDDHTVKENGQGLVSRLSQRNHVGGYIMKRFVVPFLIAMVLGVGLISFSFAADTTAPGTEMFRGDLLKIEGEYYVVRDMAGKEIRLHVDKTTALDGVVKEGDKIEAQATENNHAASIKHLQPKK
jgi:hypothetical protein